MAGAWRTSGSTGRADEPLIGWRPAATAVKIVVGRIAADSDSGIVRRGIAADEQQAEHEQGQSEIFHRRHLRAGADGIAGSRDRVRETFIRETIDGHAVTGP